MNGIQQLAEAVMYVFNLKMASSNRGLKFAVSFLSKENHLGCFK